MTQTVRNASALFARLRPVYTDQLELPHTAATHPTQNLFLTGINDVFCIMVHETDGSVARNRARSWYDDYRRAAGTGGGPQLVIWPDGTVMSLVELPYRTTHGNSQNNRAIGIETGHGNDGRYGDVDVAPDVRAGVQPARQGWSALSAVGNDVPGSTEAKAFALHAVYNPPAHPPAGYPAFQSEVVTALWSTDGYRTPARERPRPPGALPAGMYATLVAHHGHAPPEPTLMLFTESHYRSWALLTRYLCEALLVPRNFPVLPHARRDHASAAVFKRLVLADERFDMIVGGLSGPYLGRHLAFTGPDFTGTTPADDANFQAHYSAADAPAGSINFGTSAHPLPSVAMNVAWQRFFDFYRGIQGHAFSGNQIAAQDDHDCPGQMFDWHRFAREIWDWWWWPFDFNADHTRTDPPQVPERPYRRADGTTPLVEYFFHEAAAPYAARAAAPGGIQGPTSSSATFRLEENANVYAIANGELVAARYPTAGVASMAFVLVRNEIFHVPDLGGVARANGVNDATHPWDGGLADPGRIDYDAEPSTVYTLYMHLGRPNQLNFGQVNDQNPDWLNRVLIRMTECDLALPPAAPGTLNPALNAWQADFTQPPSLTGDRLTPLEAWQTDQADYRRFLTRLAAGDVAVAPFQSLADPTSPTPVRVLLGDFLGIAGVIRQVGGAPTFGVRVEVFSPAELPAGFFNHIQGQAGWTPPAGVAHPVLDYQSEWAHAPSAAEEASLRALGVDPAAVNWWNDVWARQFWDVRMPRTAKLPVDGHVFHYDPIDFMQWLNDVTWSSEWPKYRITAGGALAARPAAPRSRWV